MKKRRLSRVITPRFSVPAPLKVEFHFLGNTESEPSLERLGIGVQFLTFLFGWFFGFIFVFWRSGFEVRPSCLLDRPSTT
jgi:hypothetical protein